MQKILYIFSILCFLGCGETPLNISNTKIANALNLRKEEFIHSQLKICKANINSEAQKYVDSLVSAEFLLVLSDSVFFPDRPIRETPFVPVVVPDTIRANPIFPISN